MLTHDQIWAAVDALALRADLTPSGLAKLAGLDPTTFNKSKRKTSSGKDRWPSTESISKILQATGYSLEDFVALVISPNSNGINYRQSIPFLETLTSNNVGFSDDGVDIEKENVTHIPFPNFDENEVYAVEVNGDTMQPLYRNGDILIVSPNSEIRRKDRILIRTNDDKFIAGVFENKTNKAIEFKAFSKNQKKEIIAVSDIQWTARILWASQ